MQPTTWPSGNWTMRTATAVRGAGGLRRSNRAARDSMACCGARTPTGAGKSARAGWRSRSSRFHSRERFHAEWGGRSGRLLSGFRARNWSSHCARRATRWGGQDDEYAGGVRSKEKGVRAGAACEPRADGCHGEARSAVDGRTYAALGDLGSAHADRPWGADWSGGFLRAGTIPPSRAAARQCLHRAQLAGRQPRRHAGAGATPGEAAVRILRRPRRGCFWRCGADVRAGLLGAVALANGDGDAARVSGACGRKLSSHAYSVAIRAFAGSLRTYRNSHSAHRGEFRVAAQPLRDGLRTSRASLRSWGRDCRSVNDDNGGDGDGAPYHAALRRRAAQMTRRE